MWYRERRDTHTFPNGFNMKHYNRTSYDCISRREISEQVSEIEIGEFILENEPSEQRARALADAYSASELLRWLDDLGRAVVNFDGALWHAYLIASDREDRAYREANERKLWAYYHEHVNDEGDFHDWWDFFSDWHKDVYGFRPHWSDVHVPYSR